MRALRIVAIVAGAFAPVAAYADAVIDADNAVMAARSGQYEQAIDLFTRAINSDELSLKSRAQAFAYRGIAHATLGDYDAARLDLTSAVALDSDYNADAYAFRGYLELVTGDAARAAADLEKSVHLNMWPYNALWLHLARLNVHVPDTDDISLQKNMEKLAQQRAARSAAAQPRNMDWPRTVMQFYLGQRTVDDVLTGAKGGDPAGLAERMCDANFYVAEYRLVHGDTAAARPLFQQAEMSCPAAAFERMGATAELSRMK